jgi:hypothetical protein
MMQVFLPFPDFRQSVACLDRTRLGNQIWREAKTLLNGGWANHPAARMWANYKPALVCYMYNGLQELHNKRWIKSEPFNKTVCELTDLIVNQYSFAFDLVEARLLPEYNPPFIGNEDFHRSHRLNLLFKDPTHYSRFFSDPVPTTKPEYIWPIPEQV